jgi:hypothetical protein
MLYRRFKQPYFATAFAKAMADKKASAVALRAMADKTKGIACVTLRPCRLPVSRGSNEATTIRRGILRFPSLLR